VRALDADRPLRAPIRFLLDGVTTVEVGRGDGVALEDRDRRLVIGLDDARVSGRHARLERAGDGFTVVDLQSRNGTFVEGARIDRVELRDGDLIEVGHTLLLYRAAVPVEGREPVIADAAHSSVRGLGLASLHLDLHRALRALAEVARTAEPVLVLGEPGTGKERAGRAIHAASGRPGPLVAVRCAAFPERDLEGALFGHVRGAHPAAVDDRDGTLRAADGGTLFLDELADLAPAGQAALVRALRDGAVVPVGATAPVPLDVRIVAASCRDLPTLIRDGRFREDLYARLAGYTLHLPPLRERREDLGLLIAALLADSEHPRAGSVRFEPGAARALFHHPWPRNVHELERCLGAALSRATDGIIGVDQLPLSPTLSPGETADLANRLRNAATEHRGHLDAVARALGATRLQTLRWARRFGIDLPRR